MDDLTPNDLSHLSDEEFIALCPQGEHAPGPEPLSPAALRALADQVAPDEGHTLPIHVSSAEWLRFRERKKIRAAILAIATELENGQ